MSKVKISIPQFEGQYIIFEWVYFNSKCAKMVIFFEKATNEIINQND